MKLKSHLKTAMRNLMASRLRTFLAMMGLMVGTASVVALISGGRLATEQALEQFKSLGTDLMRVDMSTSQTNHTKISINVLMAIQTSVPGIRQIAPLMLGSLAGRYQQKTLDYVNVIGSTENLAQVIRISLKKGRFISDLDKNQNFCVLGNEIAKRLKSFSLLGQSLSLGKGICIIIGILNPWAENNIIPQNVNTGIIVPYASMQQILNNADFTTVLIRLKENTDIDGVKQAITDYFKKNLPTYRVAFQSSKEILNRMAKQQGIFSLLLGLIGGISLLVGGIGVMNIMLASVAERHPEIGLRIALGAQPRDVQLMFLIEAAVLAIIGGVFGVIIGILSTVIIAYFANWPFVFLIWPPIIGFSVSLVISLFFGFYPAYVASKLNPIEILHAG